MKVGNIPFYRNLRPDFDHFNCFDQIDIITAKTSKPATHYTTKTPQVTAIELFGV